MIKKYDTALGRLMQKEKITQAELAAKARVSQTGVSNLLIGRSKNPSIFPMYRVARALGMSVYEIFPELFARLESEYDEEVKNGKVVF